MLFIAYVTMTWIWATYCQVSKGVDNIGEKHLKWKFLCRWTMRIRSWNQQWTHLHFATVITAAMTNNCRFCCSNTWTKQWMVLVLRWLLAKPPAALLSDMGCNCSWSKIHHPEVKTHLYSTHSWVEFTVLSILFFWGRNQQVSFTWGGGRHIQVDSGTRHWER